VRLDEGLAVIDELLGDHGRLRELSRAITNPF